MKKIVLSLALALAAFGTSAQAAAPTRATDDSYTVSQRWEGYKDKYPGIAWPAVTFKAGQKVLFAQQYKVAGPHTLHIDVFLPVGKSKQQGIVLVHGGGWRSGSRDHFYALANRLAQRGYTVFLPEFRLSAEAPYPAGLIDVNDAIVWAKAHAAEYGFTKDKLAIGGASSGGQMASLIAYSSGEAVFKSDPAQDTSVNALIDIDGVLDFTTPMALQYENKAGPESLAALWLGGSFEQAPDTWRQASALSHLGAKSPPTLVISSGLVRFTAGREAVEAGLKTNNIRYQFYTFANAPHDVWLFEPWQSKILDTIDQFLQGKKP